MAIFGTNGLTAKDLRVLQAKEKKANCILRYFLKPNYSCILLFKKCTDIKVCKSKVNNLFIHFIKSFK